MRHLPLSRRHTGFTLIEVMVALLIMSVVAVMAWQGVDGIVRSREGTQQRLEQTLRLSTVVAQWEHDLAAVQDTKAIPAAVAFDGANLRLTRRTEQGVQIVVWTLQRTSEQEGASGVLTRWASKPVTTNEELIETWMQSLQSQGREPDRLAALPGVSQWQVYFNVSKAWTNAQSTGNVGQSPGQGASAPVTTLPPQGVRLVLTFAPGSGRSGQLVRDTTVGPS